jgi:energy-coupling factor transporter ATP-binding protein EcfA2
VYINQVTIRNIRSIEEAHWEVQQGSEPGWHVVIGDNGSGKSTFLRSIALALVGPSDAAALRQDWNDWLSRKSDSGSIRLDLNDTSKFDKWSGSGRPATRVLLPVEIAFARQNGEVRLSASKGLSPKPERHVWGGKAGWFAASYGPFRRFAGGDKDYEKLFYSNPRLASHLSVFGEDVALTECLRWLQELQFKKLERDPAGDLIDAVKEFVNQKGFLPHEAQLHEVSSRGVEFVDGNGYQLPVEELSDGYRSILSMTFELIRQLSRVYSTSQLFEKNDYTRIVAPGVVLVDEIDAHLHPTWQRRVGLWFREHFPKLQFIVSTHSPLVCQAADVGTVFRLPQPGTDMPGQMVTGTDLERLLYGNVLDAYSTELFGSDISRSEESKRHLRRLAELNQKELDSRLTKNERAEQERLRRMFPTTPHKLAG